ncbi:hypothetical protein FYZ45_06075 [Mobiluncus mulieris]|uniref:TACI cysteine-rich domain-containing protein n=1 Tax=Mobiluncus mulieris TaxID=2052 RepID=A0ABD4TZ42_9ACTO|nr:hypothetical protein [Mobiluncus mulieris]MCU9973575.1 hypothetical protein [Mobiluncus mulieris]MCU9997018.1 hypothetical protein [Mobiluncus mulieris]MCV0009508.1 hypothetical protein [Mobiluncus mulieris]MCV0014121.1 hypothetical protein [Mobiluncus mulieris]
MGRARGLAYRRVAAGCVSCGSFCGFIRRHPKSCRCFTGRAGRNRWCHQHSTQPGNN